MSHEITRTDNFARRFGSRPAWHGLGLELPADVTTAISAGEHAGILWRTSLAPLQATLTSGAVVPVTSGERAQVRDDTGEVLGIVGARYAPVQNRELAELADATGLPVETVGTLSGGLRAFFLMRAAGSAFSAAPGDDVESYVLAANAHAMSGVAAFYPTTVRVVCRNTLRASERDIGRGLTIRHVGDVQAKLAMVRRAIESATAWHAVFAEQAKALARVSIDDAARRDYFAAVYIATFEDPAKIDDAEKRAAAHERQNDTVRTWSRLLDTPTNAIPSIRGTLWQALQVVVEWHDHHRPRVGNERDSAEKWNTGRLFGSGAAGKDVALRAALALV